MAKFHKLWHTYDIIAQPNHYVAMSYGTLTPWHYDMKPHRSIPEVPDVALYGGRAALRRKHFHCRVAQELGPDVLRPGGEHGLPGVPALAGRGPLVPPAVLAPLQVGGLGGRPRPGDLGHHVHPAPSSGAPLPRTTCAGRQGE